MEPGKPHQFEVQTRPCEGPMIPKQLVPISLPWSAEIWDMVVGNKACLCHLLPYQGSLLESDKVIVGYTFHECHHGQEPRGSGGIAKWIPYQLTWVCAKRPTNQEESRLSTVCALAMLGGRVGHKLTVAHFKGMSPAFRRRCGALRPCTPATQCFDPCRPCQAAFTGFGMLLDVFGRFLACFSFYVLVCSACCMWRVQRTCFVWEHTNGWTLLRAWEGHGF